MAKLTDAHVEQIRNMRSDGKTYKEIIEFFWQTYKIKLYTNQIVNHSSKKKATNAGAKIRMPHKSRESVPIPAESPDDFVTHIRAAFDIYKRGFLKRAEEVLTAL